MLEAVGHPVTRLHRSRYAGLTLKGLGPGDSRELTGAEVIHAYGATETTPLVAVNPEASYAMASTTKVVTSLAALDLLGVNFRWRTFAFLQGALVDGTILGEDQAKGLASLESREVSLGFTDPLGLRDLDEPANVRSYIMASTQHSQALLPLPNTVRLV